MRRQVDLQPDRAAREVPVATLGPVLGLGVCVLAVVGLDLVIDPVLTQCVAVHLVAPQLQALSLGDVGSVAGGGEVFDQHL